MKKEMMPRFLLFLVLAASLATSLALPAAGARINEIMYNPDGYDYDREFIEIFTTNPANLSGWVIADSESNDTLACLRCANSSYALITEEGFDYSITNASVYSAGATIGNDLDNTADEIFLYNTSNALVASASYDGSIANGNGKSMELVEGEWLESVEEGGTPGRMNTAEKENVLKNETTNSSINSTINTSSNSSINTTNTTVCGIEFSVHTDKGLYNNSEKVSIYLDAEGTEDFIIEYWVETLGGNIVKAKYNTTNTNTKSWTPKIDEEDKSFLVRAVLYANCSSEPLKMESESLITVIGVKKPQESSINIKKLYLGSDDYIEFGKQLRARLLIYKGDERSSVVEAWIEDLDSGERISSISKMTLYEKFREYDLTVPVQIKNNCDREYDGGSYTFVVEGLNMTDKREVVVEGIVSSLCPNQPLEKEPRLSYEISEFKRNITIGSEFSTAVSISNDGKSHTFEVWSYVYRGSKCYSGEREENKKTIRLDPGETAEVELKNIVTRAEPGDYKFKVKIRKDSQKTTKDLRDDVHISAPEPISTPSAINSSIDKGVESMLSRRNSTGNNTPGGENSLTGKVIYRSSSSRAEGLAVYFIIGAMAVAIMILAFRLKRSQKRGKATQKL